MLRITKTLKGSTVTIKVDGRLVSEEIKVFVQECADDRGALVIDLSDLQFADAAGLRVLQEVRAQGARIVGARPYLSLQLAEPGRPFGDSP